MRAKILRITRVLATFGVVGIAGAAFLGQGSLIIDQAGGGLPVAHAVPLDAGNGNANDNAPSPPPPPPPPPPPTVVSDCIASSRSVSLPFPGGAVIVTNPAPDGIGVRVERAAARQGPVGMLNEIVFNLVGERCEGGPFAEPVPGLNLGIDYTAPGPNTTVRIVRLEGTQWVDLPTVPDPNPNRPYVSATVPAAPGTYSVVRR